MNPDRTCKGKNCGRRAGEGHSPECMAEHEEVTNPTTFTALTREVVTWADSAFPGRTPSSAFLKMFSEIGEVVEDPTSPGEWADVFIMLLDLAHMHHIDLPKAIRDKLEVNRGRTWRPGPMGAFRHASGPSFPDLMDEPAPVAMTMGPFLAHFYNLGAAHSRDGTGLRSFDEVAAEYEREFLYSGKPTPAQASAAEAWNSYGRGFVMGQGSCDSSQEGNHA
jgi:NTP pyrophosphatase (non-canonical NTP hydrolase)